ncbi:hypothetical protein CHARACLAT_027265 [Characodon lateralis]|uniref:Uncharacterized protein n=1 Tax=Characodon lateralis TaxID=208331 RepID=A0ABU7DUM9_9TELE|nr:hypothetical protein [Characodon lateralis]
MLECGQNTLQCSVLNVSPAEYLTVTFYRGAMALGHMKSTSNAKEPIDETFILSYNTSIEDNGAQFWCEAKLDLGYNHPKPPLVVKSGNLSVRVHCKPEDLETTSKPNSNAPSVKLYRFILCLVLFVPVFF